MFTNVVDTKDCGATLVGEDGCAHTGSRRAARRRGIAHDLAQRALARDPNENRPAQCGQLVETSQELEVVLHRLAEADPGVEADRLLRDSLLDRERKPLVEEARDFGNDV